MLWKMLHALLGYIVFVLLQKEKCVVLHFWNLFESFFKSLCKILLFVNDGLSWAALGSGQRQGRRKEYKRSVSSSLIFIVLFLHSKCVCRLVYRSWSGPGSWVVPQIDPSVPQPVVQSQINWFAALELSPAHPSNQDILLNASPHK
jgi:hypothetical protein